MKKRNLITVIIPLHEVSENIADLFKNAVKSVEDQSVKPTQLLIVTPKGSDAYKFATEFDYQSIKELVKVVENDGKTDFASQMNFGVSQCETEWFSILEYDDEYSKIWFKNVHTYIDAYSDVDIFMPMIVDVDEAGQFIGFTNEAVWANSFSEELGILDKDALLAYQNFNIDGIVMKKEVYESYGGFKSNIKLTFIYEFLLRMTYKSAKVMTIPKFGYKHVNQRVGSLFHSYKSSMNPVEANWWLNKAKSEFYHEYDREISYND
jgi:hypothetical protein